MRVKGVITVYLTMIFLVVVAVIFTTIESARIQTTRMLAETAVDSALESLLAGYQRELYEEYDLFFFQGNFGEGRIKQEKITGKIEEYMDYTIHPNRDVKIDNTDFYQMNTESISLTQIALATDDGGKVFREQAIDYMRSKMGVGVIEALKNDYEWASNNLNQSNGYISKKQETEEALILFEDEKAKADEEKQEESNAAKEQYNPTVQVDNIRSTGILELMYQDSSKLSQNSVDLSKMPSKRTLNKGNGLEQYENGMVANILFQSYLMEKFPHAASETESSKDNLTYQLEYLLIGKEHDIDNLKGVVNQLLLVREGANFAYLLTDAGKVAEAYSAATLLVGYTCLPMLVEATKYAILLSWAYAESVIDVKVLLSGEKTALVKNAENWRTTLLNIGELANMDVKEMGDNDGISYETYLRMLLMMANQDELTMRALDLIEIQMKSKTSDNQFQVDDLVAVIQADVKVNTKSIFLSLPIMSEYHSAVNKNLQIIRRYGYDVWKTIAN